MKDRISALMDGELDEESAGMAIGALTREGEAADTWRTYHLISDAMRDTRLLSGGFTARVAARLATEHTVLAPARLSSAQRRWLPMAAAAGAAVAFVGWMAFAPQPESVAVLAPVAQLPDLNKTVDPKPHLLPIPAAANDYLLAHQGFSPRVSLQGMAPYVRSVADEASRK